MTTDNKQHIHPRPITAREILLCSIPLAILYLLQLGTSKGLSFAGFLSLGTYLLFMITLLPRVYKRQLSIISILLLGGGFALLLSLSINLVHMIFAPWSHASYFILVGFSGVDGPSLIIPATILIKRSALWVFNLFKNKKESYLA